MVNIWSIIGQTFGVSCPLCGAPGDGVCSRCMASLPYNAHACPCCALPLAPAVPISTPCGDCQVSPPGFDRVHAPLLYQPPIDDLLAGFKYHDRLYLGRCLGGLLLASLTRPSTMPLLLPIPAHPGRLHRRGFNQAAELARLLAAGLGLDWSASRLRRTIDRAPQRGAGRGQRRRNVRGTFACDGMIPAHVVLVDDVVTTGATVNEASRVLKRAGAETVEVWAIARTPGRPLPLGHES